MRKDDQIAQFGKSAEMEVIVPEEILLKIFHPLLVADLCRCERCVSWHFDRVLVFSLYFSFSPYFICLVHCMQCFDAVGWAAGRASGL